MANARTVDKIDTIPEFFLKKWVRGVGSLLSPDQWAWISLILFGVSLLAFMMYMVGRRELLKKAGFTAGLLLLAGSFSCLLILNHRKGVIRNNRGAIIMLPSLNVKSSPDVQSTSVFVLHEGTRVMLIDSVQDWKEIRIADGNKGWIPSNSIREI
jgi:hypothetical protein